MAKSRAARLGYADEMKVRDQLIKFGIKAVRVDRRLGQLGADQSCDLLLKYPNGQEKPLEQKRVKGGFKTIRKWLDGAPEGSLLTVTEPNKPTLIISTIQTHGEVVK